MHAEQSYRERSVAQGRRRVGAGTTIVIALIVAVLAPALPANGEVAAPTILRTTLSSGTLVNGLSTATRMVATDDHVFIASGQTGSSVAIMNDDGTQAGTLTGIPGPVALDTSATKLFVAAWGDSSIWVYTLTTSPPSKVATLSTLPTQQPTSLALASGRLWFTGLDEDLGPHGSIGSMKTDGTDVQDYYPPNYEYWQYNGTCGDIDHSDFAPARIFVHGNGCGAPDVLYEYSSSAVPPVRLADYGWSDWGTYGGAPIAVMPDGNGVIVNRNQSLQVLSISDLSLTSETYAVPSGNSYGQVVTGAAAGGRIASAAQLSSDVTYAVELWQVGDPDPTNAITFPVNEGQVGWYGLAFSPSGDTLFATTQDWPNPGVYFHAIDPSLLGSALTMQASRDTVHFGENVTLTGTLEGPPAGSTITFLGDEGSGPSAFDSCQTDATGSCSVSLAPSAEISVGATYAGDATYSPTDSGAVRIQVHVVVSGKMRRFSGTQGKYRHYGPREKIVYIARVRPPHPNKNVTIHLMYNFGSGWKDGGHGRFPQNVDGYVGIYFKGGSLPQGKYRLQSSQGPDADHLGGRSAWSYFRVTGRSRVAGRRNGPPSMLPIVRLH
jgi:hypothetical protein